MNAIKPTDPPYRYSAWTKRHDSTPKTPNSYKQLKSSAKYILSKFKTDKADKDRNGHCATEQLDTSDSRNSSASTEDFHIDHNNNGLRSTSTNIVLGSNGEIISEYKSNSYVLDWLPYLDGNDTEKTNFNIKDQFLYPIFETKGKVLRFDHLTNDCYIIKFGTAFFEVSNGTKKIFKHDLINALDFKPVLVDSSDYFILFNKKREIVRVYSYFSSEVVGEFDVDIVNDDPVFDLKGSTLLYCINKNLRAKADKSNLSHVDLSSKKSLINKLIKTFSNSALDFIFLLSDTLQQPTQLEENLDDEQIRNKYKNMLVKIYNSINKHSSYVKALDLKEKNSTLFEMSIPMGVSKLSISPYDLQFVSVSSRGDELFLWDFTNPLKSIILLDKYSRGKTSGVIERLDWGTGNSAIIALSRNTGSLHLFINDSLRNYEDFKIRRRTKSKKTNTSEALENNSKSWCLSCMKIKDFKVVRSVLMREFIVGISSEGGLLIIECDRGLITGYYQISKSELKLLDFKNDLSVKKLVNFDVELINYEIEVETCKPFRPIYNDRNFKFQKMKDVPLSTSFFSNINQNVEILKEYNIARTFYDRQHLEQQEKHQIRESQKQLQERQEPSPELEQ